NFTGKSGRNCAGIDVGAAALERLHGAAGSPENFFEGRRITDHGEEKVRRGGDFLRRFGEFRPCGNEFLRARGGAVPDRKRVAGLDEIHAHRATHQAQTNESNFFGSCGGFQRMPPRKQRVRSASVMSAKGGYDCSRIARWKQRGWTENN